MDIEQLLIIGSEILDMAEEKKIDIIEACVLYSEKTGMEIEVLGEILKRNKKITSEIEKSASDLNLLKDSETNRLVFENE